MTVQPDLDRRGAVRHSATFGDALRFTSWTALLGVVVAVASAVWIDTCTGAVADSLACGTVQRSAIAAAAPAVFGIGAAWAFLRARRHDRDEQSRHDVSVVWRSAGWLLLIAALVVVAVDLL